MERVFPWGDDALKDLGRRWEGLVFRRASVRIRRDGDSGRDGGGYLVACPDCRVPHWVEVCSE